MTFWFAASRRNNQFERVYVARFLYVTPDPDRSTLDPVRSDKLPTQQPWK
jgi:hypothetical protein